MGRQGRLVELGGSILTAKMARFSIYYGVVGGPGQSFKRLLNRTNCQTKTGRCRAILVGSRDATKKMTSRLISYKSN